MPTIFKRIIQAGLNKGLSPAIEKRMVISNIYGITCGTIVFGYSSIFVLIGIRFLGFLGFLFGLVYFLVPWLNYFRHFRLSRLVFVVNFNFILYVYSSTFGRDSGIHFWYATAALMPFILYELSEFKTILIFFTITASNFLFIWITKFQYPFFSPVIVPELYMHWISILMIFGSTWISFSVVYFLAFDYKSTLEKQFQVNHLFENNFKALNASSIVAFTDVSGKITYVNDHFCRISGYSREELLGNTHRVVKSGYHSREFFAEIWKTVSSKKIWEGEMCNRSKSGSFYWVYTTIVPLLSAKGEIEQYVAIRFDITQKKLAEQASIQSARLASLGEMASGIAHEVNNPVGVIQARARQMLKQLRMGDFSEEKATVNLEKVVLETERIAKIIKSLRLFSRNGEKDPFESIDLPILIEDVVELCAERFRSASVQLQVDAVPACQLECRAVQIGQVLTNLLNNSFDAVSELPDRWVQVSFKKTGPQLEVAVTDSGSGIPVGIIDKLMQPFFTTKEVGKGTGLGLSISRGIVEGHGGHLWVDQQSKHTRFVFSLPIQQLRSTGAGSEPES